jgi:hypothetical protein
VFSTAAATALDFKGYGPAGTGPAAEGWCRVVRVVVVRRRFVLCRV